VTPTDADRYLAALAEERDDRDRLHRHLHAVPSEPEPAAIAPTPPPARTPAEPHRLDDPTRDLGRLRVAELRAQIEQNRANRKAPR
jgi:hypothetical protein